MRFIGISKGVALNLVLYKAINIFLKNFEDIFKVYFFRGIKLN